MPEATKPTVQEALAAVMGEVQAVKKRDRNTKQNYSFRGVDAVVNAVGPALRNHGVIVVPIAEEIASDHYYTSKNDANMRNVTLRIRWRIHGPAGDHIEAVTYGEAADSGDKAVSKAHSVALRTVLLQALCIPTDDPEPDAQSHERSAPPAREQAAPDPRDRKMRQMFAMLKQAGITEKQDSLDYVATVIGHDIGSRNELTLPELVQVIDALKQLLEADTPVAPPFNKDDDR